MMWVESDGGRAAAGYKGTARDCFVRAVCIAGGLDYQTVYDIVTDAAKRERSSSRKLGRSSARDGVHRATARRVLADMGWAWTPTMQIGSGCRVHLRSDELPPGRLVCALSRHFTAVADGVVYDTHDPTRGGSRCVYGYWEAPGEARL